MIEGKKRIRAWKLRTNASFMNISSEDKNSTHSQKRHALVFFVAGDSLSSRVDDGDAIHHKLVTVVAMVQRNTGDPSAIGLAEHGIGRGIPIVKVAKG
jgi:hypothetical protein